MILELAAVCCHYIQVDFNTAASCLSISVQFGFIVVYQVLISPVPVQSVLEGVYTGGCKGGFRGGQGSVPPLFFQSGPPPFFFCPYNLNFIK